MDCDSCDSDPQHIGQYDPIQSSTIIYHLYPQFFSGSKLQYLWIYKSPLSNYNAENPIKKKNIPHMTISGKNVMSCNTPQMSGLLFGFTLPNTCW